MDKKDQKLAKRITEFRERSGYSVMDIVKNTNISRDMMYAYESARRPIPSQALIEIAEFLSVSLDELVGLKVTTGRINVCLL